VNKIDPQFSVWLVKAKLKHSLAVRFVLRFHASLLLAGAVATGWVAGKLLFLAGIESMLALHLLSVLAAYGGFLVGLRCWIEWSGIKDYLNSRRSEELTEGPITMIKEERKSRAGNFDVSPLDFFSLPDFDGCAPLLIAILIALAAVAVFYLMGGYLVVHATDFFAEIVFELLLASGLIKGVRKLDLLGTEGRVPLITLWPLAGTLLTVFLFDLWAGHEFPQARTIGQIVNAIRGR
jgi:hypothetical protein